MTNLTEQWEKGELPSGEYYIRINGVEKRACYCKGIGFFEVEVDDIEKILDKVPSYELWKAVHEQWKVLLKENTKLKELLEDCYFANQAFIRTFEWLETIITPTQKDMCRKTAEGIKKIQSEIDEVLK